MFGHRYFPARHFAPRYFPVGGTATPAPIVGVLRLMELHDVRLRELHRPSLVERASVRLREVTR